MGTTLLNILLVTIMISGVSLVLLLIGYLADPGKSATKEDRDRLLHDLETSDRVITSNSAFRQFLGSRRQR